jgi:hypothetical protein
MKKLLSLIAVVALGSLSSSCVVALGNDAYPECDECGKRLCAECEANSAECTECESAEKR